MEGMDNHQTSAILAALVKSLRDHGSWCGETHLQKACFFLNQFTGDALPFKHTLYKHGPYSFDLCDKLTEMRANGLLTLEFQQPPYGPRYTCTENGLGLKERYPRSVGSYEAAIERVATFFGNRGVGELERLSTALYVMKTERDASIDAQTEKIHELKPHIQKSHAELAIKEVRILLDAA